MIDNIDETLKGIKISKYQTNFQQCQEYFEASWFGDFNDENLNKISKENPNMFNQLLRVLALYNITFKGFHSRLNIIVDTKDTFSFEDYLKLNDIFQHEQLKRILSNLGFETKESLSGVNRQKLMNYLSGYIPMEIIEKEFGDLCINGVLVSLNKNVKLNNEFLNFSSDQFKLEIKITDTSMRIINQHFEDDQIRYVEDLPEDLDLYFSRKMGVGIGKKEKLFEYLDKISNRIYIEQNEIENNLVVAHKEFGEGELLINGAIYQIPLKYLDREIDYKCFTPTIAKYLENEGDIFFKDLKGNIMDRLGRVPKLGSKKIDQFLQFLIGLTQYNLENQDVIDFKGFCKLVCESDEKTGCDERNLAIFLSRYKGFTGGVNTLEFVAKEYNLTRERVRQIVKKTAIKFVNNFYWFWIELRDYKESKPFFTVNQIEELFDVIFTFEECRFIGAILAELSNGWKYEEEGFYHQASYEEIQMMQGIVQIEMENLFSSKLYVNDSDLNNLLQKIQKEYTTIPVYLIWENSDVKQLIIEGNTNLFIKASLESMAYKVYCMYFSEGLSLPKEAAKLIDMLKQELPSVEFNFTERSITAYIQRTAYLWNRGYYVPKTKIENYKLEQFNEIIESIELHLKENNLPEMSINLIFERFQEKLALMNIDNHYALYTILKFLEPSTIYFRKVPYIRLIENADSEHVTQVEQIEEFFFNAGEPLDRSAAFEYFTKTVGLPTFSFEQRLTLDCNSIVQYNATQYVHIDNVEVDEEKLNMLVTQLKNEVEKFDVPIPITIIKKALLKRAKINSYHLLFSLIKYYYPDVFTFYRYPQISNKEVIKLGQVSLKGQLEQYLLEQGKVVFISQINNHFTSQGWTQNEISIRFSLSHMIVPIEKGAMYVHRDILELTEAKIDKLAKQVYEYYVENQENQGYFFISVNDDMLYLLQQAIEFPKLTDNQVWTVDLLKAVLKISGRFFTPFIKDTVLFTRDNKFNLEDIESIIVHTLKVVFEGRTTIKKLEQWLVSHEVMTYKYFKRILEDDEAQYQHDGIIIWIRQ
ncbi:hypothetical protein [Lysinibacillus capsici]|uniref:hypothetical protein n=1 Tax=Lysinibacillus capsici TaxID=2115968 RepID=UPI001CD9A6E0|nr:hypothetical protein [Lysinibacillus capsici]